MMEEWTEEMKGQNSNYGFGKFHQGFWKIPPRVRGPRRVLENSTQGTVRGHNSDLTIEIRKSKKKCKMCACSVIQKLIALLLM